MTTEYDYDEAYEEAKEKAFYVTVQQAKALMREFGLTGDIPSHIGSVRIQITDSDEGRGHEQNWYSSHDNEGQGLLDRME